MPIALLKILIYVMRCCAQRDMFGALRIRVVEMLLEHRSDVKNHDTEHQAQKF